MTRLLLIRHGDADGSATRLYGRAPGVHLTEQGRSQIRQLASCLNGKQLKMIYTSPLDRARETAAILSQRLEAAIRVCRLLTDVDYGEWTGRAFADLSRNPDWRKFNVRRSSGSAPGGESARSVQIRAVKAIEQIAGRQLDASAIVVTHAEIIRSAICHYCRISLDDSLRISVPVASAIWIRAEGLRSRPRVH